MYEHDSDVAKLAPEHARLGRASHTPPHCPYILSLLAGSKVKPLHICAVPDKVLVDRAGSYQMLRYAVVERLPPDLHVRFLFRAHARDHDELPWPGSRPHRLAPCG